MQEAPAALYLAIDLLHVPSRVLQAQREPLPDGTSWLLRIVAGDTDAIEEAAVAIERDKTAIIDAATFFVEQILLAPESDSYRVLGAAPDSDARELRRNMALLLRWLHPDAAPGGMQSVFANRVTTAWEDVKTPERRATFAAEKQAAQAFDSSRSDSTPNGHEWHQPRIIHRRPVRVRVRTKPPGLLHRLSRLIARRRS